MSRLLHTSDWHLGATLFRHSREEDFDAVLPEIVAIAQRNEPDLIVHSGDLFHSQRPGARDLIRAMATLNELAAVAPTVVIAGNHDSPAYFRFLDLVSGPTRGRGLYFIDRYRPGREGGVLTFEACGGRQRIRLAAMPFVHPNHFWQRSSPSGTTSADYVQGMRELQADLTQALHEGYDPNRDVLVFTGHMLAGATKLNGGERAVDTPAEFAIPLEDLPAVSYAALGHVHAPQALPQGAASSARYAGSPLQMDFGEHKDTKSVVVIDADPGRLVNAEPITLTGGRRLARFEGTLEGLRTDAHLYEGMFLKALITGEEDGVLLNQRVAEIAAGAILVEANPAHQAPAGTLLDSEPADELELPESFLAYLAEEGMTDAAARSTAAAFGRLLREVDDEEPAPVPAQELLRAALAQTWSEAS